MHTGGHAFSLAAAAAAVVVGLSPVCGQVEEPACPVSCQPYGRSPIRSCDAWVRNGWSCPRLEEAGGCDCRNCLCGADVIDGPAPPQFDYPTTGFSIHVMQFRSADPAGDPNPPVTFSVSVTPDDIATNTRPAGYNGYTQDAFEKYAWCGCSCAVEAGRNTKQDSAVTTRFGDVGIAVLGRTWQLECCVDQWDEYCTPGIGTTGSYVTCADFRGEDGWTDAANNTCAFYVDSGLCARGGVVEGADLLEFVLTDAQRNQTVNWTTVAYIEHMADAVGTDAAEACCWCGGGAVDSTYESACMDFYADNYFHGAYDGSGASPPTSPPDEDPPFGYIVDPGSCIFLFGCKNDSYVDYNSSARVNDMSCDELAFSAAAPRALGRGAVALAVLLAAQKRL